MALYRPKPRVESPGDGQYLPDGYIDEDGNPKPESVRVTATRLIVGDIVLISTYEGNVGYTYRSSAVTSIDRNPNPTYSDKWKITLVDEKGKVDVFKVGDGQIYQFERQCSQETRENVEERSRNISLRCDIHRLERKVEELVDSMNWFKTNGGKNPKMPAYHEQVFTFLQSLGIMYDDVGRDLGLPARSKKKKK